MQPYWLGEVYSGDIKLGFTCMAQADSMASMTGMQYEEDVQSVALLRPAPTMHQKAVHAHPGADIRFRR